MKIYYSEINIIIKVITKNNNKKTKINIIKNILLVKLLLKRFFTDGQIDTIDRQTNVQIKKQTDRQRDSFTNRYIVADPSYESWVENEKIRENTLILCE